MKPGMPIAIVLLVGALLIGIGSATKSWFGMNEHEMSAHAGLFSFVFFIGGIGCLIGGILAMGKAAPAAMRMGMPMAMQSGGMPPMQQPYQGAPMAMQGGGMPPMQHMQPASPPCPTCRNALQFVPQ